MALHPDHFSRHDTTPGETDPITALHDFGRKIAMSLESDYGDWMREANAAWWEAAPIMARVSNEEVRRRFAALHGLIQFNPNWLPKRTCRQALAVVSHLLTILNAPPLDVHDFALGLYEPETPEVLGDFHAN